MSSKLPNPSLDKIETWDENRVFEHFQLPALGLKPAHAEIFQKQEVNGKALIQLTKEDLLEPPYNLPGGPVTIIMKEISRLRGFAISQSNVNAIIKKNEADVDELKHNIKSVRQKIESIVQGIEDIKVDTRNIHSSLQELSGKVDGLPKLMLDIHEDTVPRLFFIFPEDGHWLAPSIDSLFTKKFRLYFLCEHETTTTKYFHLAYHGGYPVVRPREFVAKYGPYIRTIMPYLIPAVRLGERLLECVPAVGKSAAEVLRVGGDVASTAYKATESSIFTKPELEFCAQTEKMFEILGDNPEATDKQVTKYTTDAPSFVQTQGKPLGMMERPDLRELQAYLQGLDNSNRLGNLQRVLRHGENGKTTVRWVCKRHASEWETTNAVRDVHMVIKSSSIDNGVTFDDATWELTIQNLPNGSLHKFRDSVTRAMSGIPLRKISIIDCEKANSKDVEALVNATTTIEILKLKMKNMQYKNILQKCLQLRELDLSGSHIRDKETKVLTEVFKKNTILQNLNLSDNYIGEMGARALAEALKMNTSLQRNTIGEMGASALAEALKVNTKLQNLDLGNNSIGKGASALAETLKMNTGLQNLNLERNGIDEEGASALVKALKTNTILQTLNVKDNAFTALSEALIMIRCLQNLDLSECCIGEKGACALAEALKMHTSLQILNLENNYIGEKGASALAEVLKMDTSLQNLNLEFNGIGEKGACALAEALKTNMSLQHLDLWGNGIGEKGAIALAEALTKNKSLRNLVLIRNDIGEKGASALAEALKMNTSLQHLNLWENGIGEKGASTLAEALKINTSLQTLNLHNNHIGEKGASALAEALEKNTSLQDLNLHLNGVGEEGRSALAEAQKVNKVTRIRV